MTDLLPHVVIVDGTMFVSSLDVANRFEKPHADVLKAIRKIIAECPAEFIEGNFSLSNYSDEIGRELPMYRLSRDAFSLLAMGFTGKQALAWKLKFIEAFKAMERTLLERASTPALSAEDRALLDELRRERNAKPTAKRLLPKPEPSPRPTLDLSPYFDAMRADSGRVMEGYGKMARALQKACPMDWTAALNPGTPDHAVAPMLDTVMNHYAYALDGILHAMQNSAEAFARVKSM